MPDAPDTATAVALACEAIADAASATVAAMRAAPSVPTATPIRARVVAARSRLRTVTPDTVLDAGADYDREATARLRQCRTALRLLASARADQARAQHYLDSGRLDRKLPAAQRRALLEGHSPSPDDLALINKLALGPVGPARTTAALIDHAQSVVDAGITEATRLRVVGLATTLTARGRQRLTGEVAIADVAARALEARTETADALAGLRRSLQSTRTSEYDVAALAAAQDVRARAWVAALGRDAVGVQAWTGRGATQVHYRPDVSATAVAIGQSLRGALLTVAASSMLAAHFAGGSSPFTERWRSAARDVPRGRAGALDAAPATGLSRLRGLVVGIEDLQVNQSKRVSILRVQTPTSQRTLVLPHFNPRYVGLRVGTSIDLRAVRSPDVLAEFTNNNTRTRLQVLEAAWGGPGGYLVDRRDLASEAEDSWLVWLVREVRPAFDALPSSINGSWSLGLWASLAVSASTLS
ncbi:hypothetical protein [Demequina sp.]|uniref:hypothetical protein n=1 Tax=Demequina sp. TaxID=2050685 RepID=UPI003A877600